MADERTGDHSLPVRCGVWGSDGVNTINYEPMPAWGCDHLWQPVVSPTKMWASSTTDTDPPQGCPAMQKRKCLICGGVEFSLASD